MPQDRDGPPAGYRTVFTTNTIRARASRASGPTQALMSSSDVLPECGRWSGVAVVAAVLSRTVRVSVGDDSFSGTRRTRLVTRTKESSMCASH